MTSSSSTPQKGDRIAPPLLQKSQTLLNAAELADRKTAALDTSKVPSGTGTNLVQSMKAAATGISPISCRQNLWISIFFDGTGNNMDADTPTNEHSNIVRLYQATPADDQVKGSYRIYVPGIGTYFPEIGDPGNTNRGMGFGAMGQARLDWATVTLEKRLAPHLARANDPSNAIDEINIAVFGFSRGATEARAFVRDFIKNKCLQQNNQLKLKHGGWRVRIRFMGLFDTVASVGLPMSTNNLSSVRINRLTAVNVLRVRVAPLNPWLRAVDLAFGEPGADPSPGEADGHASWTEDLRIPAPVEQCVHFVAAHEIRNSFPVDSTFYKGERPENCREMLYPGVHSDVGGGYRPGEEGKSGTAKSRTQEQESSSRMLSQLPLRSMYDLALAAGVPLLARTAWKNDNKRDFELDLDLAQSFTHYMNAAGWGGVPMGLQLNKHMALYFAWRFAKIRRKRTGDESEEQRVTRNEKVFEGESKNLESQVTTLRSKYHAENVKVSQAEQQYHNYLLSRSSYSAPDTGQSEYLEKLNQAKYSRDEAQNAYLSAKAQLNTMPTVGSLSKNMAELDNQLMSDAQDIYQVCRKNPEKRKQLRPHYKVLLDAYESEFVRDKGLKDERIFSFFEFYVHESLADFYKDSTLPSDPRVVYFGGDEKYKYAIHSPKNDSVEKAA